MSSRVLLLALLAACADFSRGEPSPDLAADDDAPTGDTDAGSSSFAADVHPLLVAGCQSCHASGQSAGETAFVLTGEAPADYDVTLAFIDESQPDGSRVLRKAAGLGHGGGAVYPTDSGEYRTILTWIRAGAPP